MLKRIDTSEVKIGMFIQKLEGPWMSHPFWKTKFVLTSDDDLIALRNSTVSGVFIDTSKGDDVVGGGRAPRPAGGTPSVANLVPTRPQPGAFGRAAQRDIPFRRPVAPAPAETAVSPLSTAPRRAPMEFGMAVRLANRGKKMMASIFTEIRFGRALKADKIQPLVDEIAASVMRNGQAFTSLSRIKDSDEFTYMHSVACCGLMMNMAREMGMPIDHVREAGMAGLMMDVGTANVPAEILHKPGALTAEEEAILRSHVQDGHRILEEAGMSPTVLAVCMQHHERYNGGGYPLGLAGSAIDRFARMAAICDVYDAMTSNRPHRPGRDPADVLAEMSESIGLFDMELFNVFMKSMGIYPIGSLVRLQSQQLGVVVEQNAADYTLPIVRTFFDISLKRPIKPEDVDLLLADGHDAIVSHENPKTWNLPDWDRMAAKLIGSGFRFA